MNHIEYVVEKDGLFADGVGGWVDDLGQAWQSVFVDHAVALAAKVGGVPRRIRIETVLHLL